MRLLSKLLLALAALPGALHAQRGDLLVVANKQAATATLLDVASGRTVATLPTGVGPHEVAVSRDGRWAVVTNYGAQTPGSSLTLIDLDRRAVTKTIALGGEYRRPHGAAFLPNGQLAVTVEANRAVLIVDLGRGTVLRALPTGEAGSHMLAVSPDGRTIYTANIGGGSVTALDVAGRAPARTAKVAPRTEGIALSPDGRRLWVGSNQDNTVTVLDAATLAPLDTLPAPGLPYRLALTPDGRRAVVSNPMLGAVRVFDAAGLRETALVQIPAGNAGEGGAGPVGFALSPDGRTAFVALQGRNQVGVLDLATGTVTRYMDVGAGPDGIAYAARRR
ncbi:MAG TPA: cytochrome D1 domain-containing protein [Longimicrobium sp.]|nr:cytochrome D1 domain-containing protein [Longimicrobium sp.]